MESINTINKTLFGAALAVLALAMALPQGSALAKGMDVKTADLCLVDNTPPEPEFGLEAIGTVAPVTDNRTRISAEPWTAWAVSLEGMLDDGYYGVYDDPSEPPEPPKPCEGDPVYGMPTPDGIGFENLGSDVNPEVGDTVWICRKSDGSSFNVLTTPADNLIAILKGVLVKGGKQKNKPGRCPD